MHARIRIANPLLTVILARACHACSDGVSTPISGHLARRSCPCKHDDSLADRSGVMTARATTALPCQVVVIDPAVWEQPDMRAALAVRDIGAVYRALRDVGISQRQIAALTGQS